MRKERDCLFRSRGRSTKYEVTELKSEVFMRRMISADSSGNVVLSQYRTAAVLCHFCAAKTRLGVTE